MFPHPPHTSIYELSHSHEIWLPHEMLQTRLATDGQGPDRKVECSEAAASPRGSAEAQQASRVRVESCCSQPNSANAWTPACAELEDATCADARKCHRSLKAQSAFDKQILETCRKTHNLSLDRRSWRSPSTPQLENVVNITYVSGAPMKCWTDYVREDLDALGILPSWARLGQDREAWRTKIHDLLGHTQP